MTLPCAAARLCAVAHASVQHKALEHKVELQAWLQAGLAGLSPVLQVPQQLLLQVRPHASVYDACMAAGRVCVCVTHAGRRAWLVLLLLPWHLPGLACVLQYSRCN